TAAVLSRWLQVRVLPGAPAPVPARGIRAPTRVSCVVPVVAVAQLVRVLDCDSRCRGFESPQPPHPFAATSFLREGHCRKARVPDTLRARFFPGPLAQLVEQLTLNQ